MGLKIGKVLVNGKPFDMIIDTGSDYTALKYRDAPIVGVNISPSKQRVIGVMGGTVQANGPYALDIRYKRGHEFVLMYFYDDERILGHEFFQKSGVDIFYKKERVLPQPVKSRYWVKMAEPYEAIPTNTWSYRPAVINGRWHVVRKRRIMGRVKVVEVRLIRDINWIRVLDRKYGRRHF